MPTVLCYQLGLNQLALFKCHLKDYFLIINLLAVLQQMELSTPDNLIYGRIDWAHLTFRASFFLTMEGESFVYAVPIIFRKN